MLCSDGSVEDVRIGARSERLGRMRWSAVGRRGLKQGQAETRVREESGREREREDRLDDLDKTQLTVTEAGRLLVLDHLRSQPTSQPLQTTRSLPCCRRSLQRVT